MSQNINQLEGEVAKNVFVRWWLTNDEPWTKEFLDERMFEKASKSLRVRFKNGTSLGIPLEDSETFNITNMRRMITDCANRDMTTGCESECNICMEAPKVSIESVRLRCSCTFTMCIKCERKIVEKKGYLSCPACKRRLWGQNWWLALVIDEVIDDTFECPPNNVFIQQFDEEIELQRWNKTRRNLEATVRAMNLPKKKAEQFVDYMLAQHYDTLKVLMVDALQPDNVNGLQEVADTLNRLLIDFMRKVERPVRFRKPEPDRFEPKTHDDVLNLAHRICMGALSM